MNIKLSTGNIEIPENVANDYMFLEFEQEANKSKAKYLNDYDDTGSLDDLYEKADEILISNLKIYANFSLNKLTALKIFEYNADDIIGFISEKSLRGFKGLTDGIENKLEELSDKNSDDDEHRKNRRKNRKKASGDSMWMNSQINAYEQNVREHKSGYIGLNRQEAKLNAAVLNVASGVGHGIFNIVAKGVSTAKTAIAKKELKNSLKEHFGTLYSSMCNDIYNGMTKIYGDKDITIEPSFKIEERKNKAKNIVDNARKSKIQGKDLKELAVESLQLHFHGNSDAFKLLFEWVGGEYIKTNESKYFDDIESLANSVKDSGKIYGVENLYKKILIKEASKNGNEGVKNISRLDDIFFSIKNSTTKIKCDTVYESTKSETILKDISDNEKESIRKFNIEESVWSEYKLKKYCAGMYNKLGGESVFSCSFFVINNNSNSDKTNKARDKYANYSSKEIPLFQYDGSVMGGGGTGFIITDKFIWSSEFDKIALSDIIYLYNKKSMLINQIGICTENDSQLAFINGVKDGQKVCELIEKILKYQDKSWNPKKPANIKGDVGEKSLGRSKWFMVFLALVLGGFGAHKFAVRSWGLGIIYLLLISTGISYFISWVEAIKYMTMDGDVIKHKSAERKGPFYFIW